jgi:hypothetical protein
MDSKKTRLMTFLYFAYGSNMLPARLLDRCPSARSVGVGIARDLALEFSKASKDGSGKATLVAAEGTRVPGVIFEIDLAERSELDRHEGLGSGYRRDDALLIDDAARGGIARTSSYLGTSLDAQLKPFDWYLAIVIAGANHHGLDAGHIAALRATEFVEDANIDRKTRVAAIEAMRKHGIGDYRVLLEG